MDNKIIKVDDIINSSNTHVNTEKKFNLYKLLNKKNIKIVILIIIMLVMLIGYFSISNNSKSKSENTSDESLITYQTTLQYCDVLESKLEKLLSQIDGAGQVSVMISVDGSPELVYASDSDSKTTTNSNGSTTTTSSTPIIVNTNGNSNALVLTENLPEVKGVIVVSSGAGLVSVKLDIINAVSTLLNISKENISVLKGI